MVMRTTFAALIVVLALGCATSGGASDPVTASDIALERDCNARAWERAAVPPICQQHARTMAAKRAGVTMAEPSAQQERDCYVTLEDPASTPQVRAGCRQYLDQQAELRAAQDRRKAAVLTGVLAGQKK